MAQVCEVRHGLGGLSEDCHLASGEGRIYAGPARPTAKGAGRSKLFCSKRCRQMHDRVRDRLRAEVEELEAVKERPGVKKRERVELQAAIQQRKWALTRYTVTAGARDGDDDE